MGEISFSFEIPTDYAQLPQLKGRATLEMKLRFANPVSRSLEFDRATLKIVVDGYNAPISAGNFVDLVIGAHSAWMGISPRARIFAEPFKR